MKTEKLSSEEWIGQLYPIIEEFREDEDTPLDGDEVDNLIEILRAKINLHEGNITEQEYIKLIGE